MSIFKIEIYSFFFLILSIIFRVFLLVIVLSRVTNFSLREQLTKAEDDN